MAGPTSRRKSTRLALDPGGRFRQHEHRSDRRHGRRHDREMARGGPPRDRARARQRHDLPDGVAVQHGLLEGHSGRRDRNAGRRLADEARLGRLRVRRARRRRLQRLERLHDGQASRARELQLPRQSLARQRSAGHRHRQLWPRLGRPLSESPRVGAVLRHARSGRTAAAPGACDHRRISGSCAR